MIRLLGLSCVVLAACGPSSPRRSSHHARPYVPPPPACTAAKAAEVIAGGHLTCSRHEDGKACCWGRAGEYALGYGGPALIKDIDGVTALDVGEEYACAVATGGSVTCWGDKYGTAPKPIAGLTGATQVCTGQKTACALQGDGSVTCWTASSSPTPVAGITAATQIGCGDEERCALDADGAVSCWRDGAAKKVPGIQGATAIVLGSYLSCAVVNGRYWCWGENGGNVGDTTINTEDRPMQIAAFDGAKMVSLGLGHSVVLRGDGSVVTYGEDVEGLLDATMRDMEAGRLTKHVDMRVVLTEPAVAVTAGHGHTCLRHADGGVSCFGTGTHKELGTGNANSREPLRVKFGP